MSLVTTKQLISKAEAVGFAIPAFNVYNLETLACAIEAAVCEKACVIIQIYDRLFTGDGLGSRVAELACAMACDTTVPLAVALDHGSCRDTVIRALRAGCRGIMYDGSTLDISENIARTKDIVQLCQACGVSVEGELGHIGSAALGEEDQACTPAEEALAFYEQTGVDLLAIMVGSAHGLYKKKPSLKMDLIQTVHQQGAVPLVLHGGSGIPDEQIRKAVGAGIRKINYATDVNLALLQAMAGQFTNDQWSYALDIFMRKPMEAAKSFMMSRIQLLGAAGSACH